MPAISHQAQQQPSRRREKKSHSQARHQPSDGVARHQAQPDRRAYCDPPAPVARFQQSDYEIHCQHRPEKIERDVLEQMPFDHGQRRYRDGQRRYDLSASPAAQLARHQSRHHHGHALRQCGEESYRGRRCPNQSHGNARHERRQRRIRDVSPGQVPCVVQRRQFVAMEAVLPVGERVKQQPQRG